MPEKDELFDAATIAFIHGISEQLPFDEIAETEIIQAAVAQGYDLETIKEAWM